MLGQEGKNIPVCVISGRELPVHPLPELVAHILERCKDDTSSFHMTGDFLFQRRKYSSHSASFVLCSAHALLLHKDPQKSDFLSEIESRWDQIKSLAETKRSGDRISHPDEYEILTRLKTLSSENFVGSIVDMQTISYLKGDIDSTHPYLFRSLSASVPNLSEIFASSESEKIHTLPPNYSLSKFVQDVSAQSFSDKNIDIAPSISGFPLFVRKVELDSEINQVQYARLFLIPSIKH